MIDSGTSGKRCVVPDYSTSTNSFFLTLSNVQLPDCSNHNISTINTTYLFCAPPKEVHKVLSWRDRKAKTVDVRGSLCGVSPFETQSADRVRAEPTAHTAQRVERPMSSRGLWGELRPSLDARDGEKLRISLFNFLRGLGWALSGYPSVCKIIIGLSFSPPSYGRDTLSCESTGCE
jgi:hypothetical protein